VRRLAGILYVYTLHRDLDCRRSGLLLYFQQQALIQRTRPARYGHHQAASTGSGSMLAVRYQRLLEILNRGGRHFTLGMHG
jgi:hypothetical protein